LKANIELNKSFISEPNPEALSKASVQLINKLIFDAIQEIQIQKRKRNN
jgi:hypothetical protein